MKFLAPTFLLSFALLNLPSAFAGGAVEHVVNEKTMRMIGVKDFAPQRAMAAAPATTSSFTCFTGFDTTLTGSPNPPADAIKEINDGNIDINKGFGGDYVYLQPRYQTNGDPDDCATDIWFAFVPASYHTPDLATGAGGVYRYLNWQHWYFPGLHNVTNVALWRPDGRRYSPASGWDKMTTDLNQDRGGDFLYLLFNLDG